MECFVGYSSLNKKLFFIAYDKQNKTYGNVFCREEDGSKLYDYEDMLLMFE